MKQMALAVAREFEKHERTTRKAEFLARMEGLVPWAEFCTVIEPHYPKAGNGRRPVGVERMLRCTLWPTGSTWPTKPAKTPSTT